MVFFVHYLGKEAGTFDWPIGVRYGSMLLHRDEHSEASCKGGHLWAIRPQSEWFGRYWRHYSASWGSCDAVRNLAFRIFGCSSVYMHCIFLLFFFLGDYFWMEAT